LTAIGVALALLAAGCYAATPSRQATLANRPSGRGVIAATLLGGGLLLARRSSIAPPLWSAPVESVLPRGSLSSRTASRTSCSSRSGARSPCRPPAPLGLAEPLRRGRPRRARARRAARPARDRRRLLLLAGIALAALPAAPTPSACAGLDRATLARGRLAPGPRGRRWHCHPVRPQQAQTPCARQLKQVGRLLDLGAQPVRGCRAWSPVGDSRPDMRFTPTRCGIIRRGEPSRAPRDSRKLTRKGGHSRRPPSRRPPRGGPSATADPIGFSLPESVPLAGDDARDPLPADAECATIAERDTPWSRASRIASRKRSRAARASPLTAGARLAPAGSRREAPVSPWLIRSLFANILLRTGTGSVDIRHGALLARLVRGTSSPSPKRPPRRPRVGTCPVWRAASREAPKSLDDRTRPPACDGRPARQ